MLHCAVAAIETPGPSGSFVLEGPPGAREGGWRFFGGKVEDAEGDNADTALYRELFEELGYVIPADDFPPDSLYTGPFTTETRTGRVAMQLFSLFRVTIGSSDELTLQDPDKFSIVQIPKQMVEQYDHMLTSFAKFGLRRALNPKYNLDNEAA